MKRGELSGTSTRIGAWLAVLLLIAAVGSMVAATLGDVSYLPASDEGYCLRSMQEVASQGLGALPGQFLSYLRDEKLWTFHPPSRVGFTLASAVLAHVSHWLMLDAPEWFHTELTRFLARCRAGPPAQ